jgi:hypothetical protein
VKFENAGVEGGIGEPTDDVNNKENVIIPFEPSFKYVLRMLVSVIMPAWSLSYNQLINFSWHLFSRQSLRRVLSSGARYHVVSQKFTDVSDECTAASRSKSIIITINIISGVRLSPLGTAAITGLLYQPQIMVTVE